MLIVENVVVWNNSFFWKFHSFQKLEISSENVDILKKKVFFENFNFSKIKNLFRMFRYFEKISYSKLY